MKNKILSATLLTICTFAFAACFPEEDSCNIKTAGIFIEYTVTEQNDLAVAEAHFWTGNEPGGTYLTLGACGDTIEVNGTKLRPISDLIGAEYYKATIDTNDEYDFAFNRPNEEIYNSYVTSMPPIVTITGPSDDEIARDEEFEITWDDNADGKINILISGDCFWDYPNTRGDTVADNGKHVVAANSFDMHENKENKACVAEIILAREVNGTLNDDLKGTIKGYSKSNSNFNSIPPISSDSL